MAAAATTQGDEIQVAGGINNSIVCNKRLVSLLLQRRLALVSSLG